MFAAIATILRMIKFSHSVFALPFALLAAFMAGQGGQGGFPGWGKLGLIVWCMVWARSAAMTFNRIADARLDARNPRTAARAIPAGRIRPRQAMIFLYICALLFGAGAYLFHRPLGPWFGYGNVWPAWLAAPVLAFICLYSFTKRFTWAAHFWLGAALMLAPVSAWLAVAPPDGPASSLAVWTLGGAVLLWTAGFDIIYACQDIAVDRRDGLHSLPARLGAARALWVSRLCHSLTVSLLLALVGLGGFGGLFFGAVLAAAALLLAEHLIVRSGRMAHVRAAFGLVNGVISLLLATAGIADILT
jgi:4-hydroxybenzoate polyprenyltransferase